VNRPDIPTNDAVKWQGNRFGLSPELADEAARLLTRGESILPSLLESLSDPRRFVTAHVLLTRITELPYETFPTWNGLQVTIEANGDVTIDSTQRERLLAQWRRHFQDRPHPRPRRTGGQPE
jgi:hypothetical protein